MDKAPKFSHIVRTRRAGDFVAFSLCGRRVNWMHTTDEANATCRKCVAESLAKSTQASAAR
jgi:hypothetical protein